MTLAMTAKEKQQLATIRYELGIGTSVTKLAKKIGTSTVGFPHRVVALLRKECQDKYDD